MEIQYILFTIFFSAFLSETCGGQVKSLVEELSEHKELKKVLRTRNNVLVGYINDEKKATKILKVMREAAEVIKGQGSIFVVKCQGDGKKLCRTAKVTTEPYVLRHYMSGDFHKLYDRKETTSSMVNFMRDPTGDIPWEEDEQVKDVVHLLDPGTLQRLLKKESRPILVMFYAPWCGFCKIIKPEYTAAATALKEKHVLAAMDVYRPENVGIRMKYNITGFPTIMYFHNNQIKYTFEGRNKREEIIKFMNDPAGYNPKEEEWSEGKNDVVHLSSSNFDDVLKTQASAMVMFYAPWCGHCKKMKPEYEKAATQMKKEKIKGILAAVDANKEDDIVRKYGVKGFPTIKYFQFGEAKWDISLIREKNAILEFMRNPKEPPAPPAPEPAWEEVPSEVVHLNADNFKQVLKKKKHALVMFYAPWCGHCKMAKPEFQDAAEQVKDDPTMALAAVDCTKHDTLCQTYGINGYPTIMYYSHYKDSKDYIGGRKKSDFLAFLNKQKGNVKEEL